MLSPGQVGVQIIGGAGHRIHHGSIAAVGAHRYDVQQTPVWEAYEKYPETHRVYDGHDCCSDNCEMHPGLPHCKTNREQFSALETELLLPFAFLADALAMPFHGLGHVFARSTPAAAPAAQP